MAGIDSSRQFVPLKIAVLTISDTRALEDDKSGATLAERIERAGHVLAARAIVRDEIGEIRAQVEQWIADPTIDVVITTGGAGGDPVHNEGEVGREYLLEHGVPEKSLIAETQSDDTSESAERVAVIMRRNNMHSCVAVSDGYHLFRIKRMMERQGVTVYGAPRPELKPLSRWQKMRIQMKEVLSYTLWRMHLT